MSGVRGSVVLLCALSFVNAPAAATVVTVLTSSADATVPAPNPASALRVAPNRSALIQFDLSGIPPTAVIVSAELRTFLLHGEATSDGPGAVAAVAVLGPWGDGRDVTLDPDGGERATLEAPQRQVFMRWDVSSLVTRWVAAPETNFGLALTSSTAKAVFASQAGI